MTDATDLRGCRILVVEDDYYIAADAARILRGAGAEVVGPCATEAAAQVQLQWRRPNAAVLDINLGAGPSFSLARRFREQGIPFIFTTGYDEEVIPREFSGVQRLEKPIAPPRMVCVLAQVLEPAG